MAASFSGDVVVHGVRIEALADLPPVQVITARALAPLATLLGYADQVRCQSGQTFAPRCLFLKGRDADREIAESRRQWAFDARCIPSRTSDDGVVVIIEDFQNMGKKWSGKRDET